MTFDIYTRVAAGKTGDKYKAQEPLGFAAFREREEVCGRRALPQEHRQPQEEEGAFTRAREPGGRARGGAGEPQARQP